MTRKNIFTATVILACALAGACSVDEHFSENATAYGDGNIELSLSVPDGMSLTRSVSSESNSALGGLTNVDFEQYDLRYQLAVYRIEGGDYIEAISPQVKTVSDGYEPVTYSLRLTPGRDYQVVVWADFVREGSTEDLHYDTQDFRNIHIPELPDKYVINDESKDAYYTSRTLSLSQDGQTQTLSLELQRPFAKIRMVTTDWNNEGLEMPDNFRIIYYGCKRFVNIDLVHGTSSYDELPDLDAVQTVYTATIDKSTKYYTAGYDASEHNRTLFVDYLMTDPSGQTPVHMKIEALDGQTSISSRDLATDIPIQRNWLTTLIGNLLSSGSDIQVSIDQNFSDYWNTGQEWWAGQNITPEEPVYDETTKTYHIYTREQFAWLPDNISSMAATVTGYNSNGYETLSGKGITIKIENDIDMSGVAWKPIAIMKNNSDPNSTPAIAPEIEYTVDGQGHTLKNFSLNGTFSVVQAVTASLGPITIPLYDVNAYTGVWGAFNGVMKDLDFENITINGMADNNVHNNSDGNPIDHSGEAAYFAGCIGYAGLNWSSRLNISNVHARHISIKASSDEEHVQNIGGLIGWIGVGGGNTWLDNCSAEDVHIVGEQAGGLIGQIVGSRYVGIRNCSTENIFIRMRPYYSYTKNSSGFIGYINNAGGGNGNQIEISYCTAPENVEYRDDETGEIVSYTPDSKYYGRCGRNSGNIIITE